MKLIYYRGVNGITNFGDELNAWLWEKFLPGVFDEDRSILFVGIGTLLNERLPEARETVVFGAGVGYGPVPPGRAGRWRIYALRGPISAQTLEVSRELAVTDPAVLVRRLLKPETEKKHRFAFMPHWVSARLNWEAVCRSLGLGYIDPRWEVGKVLSAINQTEVLISEAMHGAVVADALRVPWLCVHDYSNPDTLPLKWQDWASSVRVEYRPEYMFAPAESGRFAGLIGKARSWAEDTRAAMRLKQIIVRARPVLSDAQEIESLTDELESRLERFKRDLAAGRLG